MALGEPVIRVISVDGVTHDFGPDPPVDAANAGASTIILVKAAMRELIMNGAKELAVEQIKHTYLMYVPKFL